MREEKQKEMILIEELAKDVQKQIEDLLKEEVLRIEDKMKKKSMKILLPACWKLLLATCGSALAIKGL